MPAPPPPPPPAGSTCTTTRPSPRCRCPTSRASAASTSPAPATWRCLGWRWSGCRTRGGRTRAGARPTAAATATSPRTEPSSPAGAPASHALAAVGTGAGGVRPMPVCERAGMGETWRRAAGAVACGARRRMDRAPLVMLAATCPPAARLCCTGPRGRLVYAPSPLQSCPLSPALTPPPPPQVGARGGAAPHAAPPAHGAAPRGAAAGGGLPAGAAVPQAVRGRAGNNGASRQWRLVHQPSVHQPSGRAAAPAAGLPRCCERHWKDCLL